MKTINTIEQIRALSAPVYVRWSKSIALDAERGYSLQYGTASEAGLSCCKIDRTWSDWRIVRQLAEYQFVGGFCWIVTGTECGTGADGEELLSNIECLGKVSAGLIATDWRKAKIEAQIAKDELSLTKITDATARMIISESIAANRKALAN